MMEHGACRVGGKMSGTGPYWGQPLTAISAMDPLQETAVPIIQSGSTPEKVHLRKNKKWKEEGVTERDYGQTTTPILLRCSGRE